MVFTRRQNPTAYSPPPLISAPRYATVHQHFNIILIPNEAVVTPELLRGMEWNDGNMNAWGTEGGNCNHFMEASIWGQAPKHSQAHLGVFQVLPID